MCKNRKAKKSLTLRITIEVLDLGAIGGTPAGAEVFHHRSYIS